MFRAGVINVLFDSDCVLLAGGKETLRLTSLNALISIGRSTRVRTATYVLARIEERQVSVAS